MRATDKESLLQLVTFYGSLQCVVFSRELKLSKTTEYRPESHTSSPPSGDFVLYTLTATTAAELSLLHQLVNGELVAKLDRKN